MRFASASCPAAVLLAAALAAACGSSASTPPSTVPDAGLPATAGEPGATPVPDGGDTPADAGTPPEASTIPTDAGSAPADAGTIPGAGATAPDAGTPADGGTTPSDCDGLAPPTPGAAVSYALHPPDAIRDICLPADIDGTSVGALSWENGLQPHSTHVALIDLISNSAIGAYDGVRYTAIAQATGFIGTDRTGASGATDVVAIREDGTIESRSGTFDSGFGPQANNPQGGLVLVRGDGQGGPAPTSVEAWAADGSLRWSRLLPDATAAERDVVGADRVGNVLVLWDGTARYGSGLAGQWYTPDGAAGPVFDAGPGGSSGTTVREGLLFERVGSGLFLWMRTFDSLGGSSAAWTTEYPPLVAGFNAAPAWLQARPRTRLHMIHGGAGYAMLPVEGPAASCSQSIEVVSPSGTSCGRAAFPIAAGPCTTRSITVGYDGSVVQQLPTEQESCTNARTCTCTWRHWSRFFR